MSYNPNQPNQQWQQQGNPNYQQLVPNNPQGPSDPGAGNHQQSEQSYSWTDGNTQGQVHHSQQSWSWQEQTTSPIAQPQPALQMPAISPMMLQNNSHQQLHQQMHQNAMSHMQQAQAHHQQVFADMNRNMASFIGGMTPMLQQAQQPQIAYQAPPQQIQQHSQITYQSVSSPLQQQPVYQQNTNQPIQHQAQIAYEPALSTPQVQYQSNEHRHYSPQQQQPVYQQNDFHQSQQQPQIEYQPILPSSPLQQVQHQGHEHHQYTQPQQQAQNVPQQTSPVATQQQPNRQQRIYPQQPTPQRPTSQLPLPQASPPPASQQQPSAKQQLQLPSNEQSPQSNLPIAKVSHDPSRDSCMVGLEAQRKKDVESANRAGAEINRRLRELEQSKAQAQQDHDAREVRRLQEQLALVERQRREDAERRNQELADLVRSQNASQPSSAGGFDMSALQKVIRETQTQQLSARDIERVIEEQVSKRLVGMATKEDIQNAGAQMQGALSRVPAGLSQQEVQQAVNMELNNVIQGVANRMNEQQGLAGGRQPDSQPWQPAQDYVQTSFTIEELPDEAVTTPYPARQGGRAQRQLPAAETSGSISATTLPAAAQRSLPSARVAPSNHAVRSQLPAAQANSRIKTKYAALEAPPSSITSDVPTGSQISAVPAPRRAEYAALEAPPASTVETVVPVSQRPVQRIGRPYGGSELTSSDSDNAHGRSRFAALEAPPAAPTMPENAIARVDRPVSRATVPSSNASQRQGTLQPLQTPRDTAAAASQQQLEAPPIQHRQEPLRQAQRAQLTGPASTRKQLEAPPAPYQQMTFQQPQIPQHTAPSVTQLQLDASPVQHPSTALQPVQRTRQIAAPAQRQLEAPITPHQQTASQPTRKAHQTAPAAALRQLEAPPGSFQGDSGTGQELVRQGRNVARRTSER